MTPQELKNSILQLAIQGKLVEQRPEEGTAEDLYRQIQAEKQALIKAGKIKKEKAFRKITEDEMPFDIPESWIWVRLGDCTSYAYTKEKVVAAKIDPDDWSLDLEDIEKDTGRIVNFCKAGERSITGDKVVFHQGQILYSKLRPYLKKILIAPKDGICTPELVPFVAFGGIFPHFLVSVLKAPYVDYVINSVTYGVKMPRVGTETMVNLLVPLPPLEEQKRIVAKIEELMPLVDRYKKAWDKLQNLDKEFPVNMQKSILQMAFEGRLVPQNDSEEQVGPSETISNLFGPANVSGPFDIQDSWHWSTLGGCCEMYTGNSISENEKKAKYQGREEGYDYIGTKDVSFNHDINYNNGIKIPFDNNFKIAHRNSVLMCIEGGSAGKKIAILDHDVCFGNKLCMFKANAVINTYLYYWLQSTEFKKAFTVNMTGIIGGVSIKKLKSLPIPLPPLEEQKRIVAKIEELMPLVDRYKKAWSAIARKENVF